jgi:L-alanine-DL-glutamate epimerase-like enolase superfamily enzyme
MPKITGLRTLRIGERPNLLWLELTTDEGLTGLGESFRGAAVVETMLHEQVAPWLIGRDPRHIEAVSLELMGPYVGFGSSGAEVRAASAVDIALWDLAGQRHGVPTYIAMGGGVRDRIRVYNTCAGYSYNTAGSGRREIDARDRPVGPYDDQVAFMRDAGELAHSLLAEGYGAMKIWPFDVHAAKTGGQAISLPDLKTSLEPFRKVREAVGQRIEVMAELHSLWSAEAATRICRALEEYDIFWAEDPIAKMNDTAALADLRRRTRTPVCGSETIAGIVKFREFLAAHALDFVMLDVAWCGGLTEARKIAALAQSHAKPLAPHDCTGPITLIAGLHLALHAPTAIFQEVVRASLATWYRDLVTELPVIERGMALAPTAAGLGTRLQPDVWIRQDAIVRTSGAAAR